MTEPHQEPSKAKDAADGRIGGLDAWPRERLAAAVQLAWRFGAIPRPLPRDRADITPEDREVIEAADAILAWQERTGRTAFERDDLATLDPASHGVSPAGAPAEVPTGNMPPSGDPGSSPGGRIE